MSPNLLTTFLELIETPFQHAGLVWGIVPLYFALLLNEVTASKASFQTAIQTGFSFLWAAAQWIYPYFRSGNPGGSHVDFRAMLPINLMVTAIVFALGTIALLSGLRRKYPKYLAFLGHTRFGNYFMITIFPIQAHYLDWTWERLAAIVTFALPIWALFHLGLMPFRKS